MQKEYKNQVQYDPFLCKQDLIVRYIFLQSPNESL